jgi:hypothetical protein
VSYGQEVVNLRFKPQKTGAEVMKNARRFSAISWLLLVILLGSVAVAQSQDLTAQMGQVKEDVAALRNELNTLSTMVYELRQELLKLAPPAPAPQVTEKAPPKEQTVVKPETAADEKQLTRDICRAVGKFFDEADVSLKASNSREARDIMNKALVNLASELKGYSGTHRVSKLLGIYEGLIWDTYVAVALRQSVRQEQYLSSLNRHRQKYIETCPKE